MKFLIRHNDHIELHQKIRCDFTMNTPIELTSKKRMIKNYKKMKREPERKS